MTGPTFLNVYAQTSISGRSNGKPKAGPTVEWLDVKSTSTVTKHVDAFTYPVVQLYHYKKNHVQYHYQKNTTIIHTCINIYPLRYIYQFLALSTSIKEGMLRFTVMLPYIVFSTFIVV